MHQNQQLAQYDRVSSAFFLLIDSFSIIIISTADFPLLWSDQTESRQHPFLSSIPYRSTFQQLTLFWSIESPASTPSYHRFIQINFKQLTSFWSNENPVSTPFYHRFIQVKFWSFSAEITSRRQRYMEIFDDFHIEEYFHLFSFMSWILNFISIHSINEMNKWSILIIYSFMK